MSSNKRMPKNYRSMARQYPQFMAALDALGEAAAIRSEGAVHSHTRRALAAGATPEEVQHAVIAATSTIGFPNVMAALSWVSDVTGATGR